MSTGRLAYGIRTTNDKIIQIGENLVIISYYRMCRLHRPVYQLRRRSRGVQMSRGERRELLSLREWFSVELGWSERVLWEKEFNAANHHRRDHWQGVSTVHSEWLVQRDTEQICLDWCSRSSRQRLCQLALDRRTTIRYWEHNINNIILRTVYINRDGVLEDCPRARGQCEDPKSWPWPWPWPLTVLALALASTHRPPVTDL